MNESKSIFQSVTFWGAVITFASPLLVKYGVNITDQQASGIAQAVVGFIGAAITIWGRIRATKSIA